MRDEYEGMTNRETWGVMLFLNNEQESQAWAHSLARAAWVDAAEPHETWSRSESARFALEDALRDHFQEGDPLADDPSVYSDLLSVALCRVDWMEIADDLLRDAELDGYEPRDAS